MARENRRDAPPMHIPRIQTLRQVQKTEYIHGDPGLSPRRPRVRYMLVAGRNLLAAPPVPPGAASYLEAHFSLNYLGDKSAVRAGVALPRAGLVYKSIWQRVAANVTDRQGLPFPSRTKSIRPVRGECFRAPRCSDAHALTFCGARQRRKAPAIVCSTSCFLRSRARQKAHRSHDYTDSHTKLCLLLQR